MGKEISGRIEGLCKSGEMMICTADKNQIMPDFENFGFAYITPSVLEDALGFTFYPQVNILSEMDKESLENAVKAALGRTLMVVPKEDHTPYNIGSIYTEKAMTDIENSDIIAGRQDKDALIKTYDYFMEVLDVMVWLFILGAVLLGVVVLYNFGIMSFVERSRELATLKVLGFRDKKIGKLLVSQNVWLTVVGVILGLPMGVGILELLIILLGDDYELKLVLGPLTYIVSIVVTFGVSLAVGLLVARKNRRINMVEALKGAE